MSRYVVTYQCEQGHSQKITYEGEHVNLRWVLLQAALLTGDSVIYQTPPGEDSQIGKCGICGSKLIIHPEIKQETTHVIHTIGRRVQVEGSSGTGGGTGSGDPTPSV